MDKYFSLIWYFMKTPYYVVSWTKLPSIFLNICLDACREGLIRSFWGTETYQITQKGIDIWNDMIKRQISSSKTEKSTTDCKEIAPIEQMEILYDFTHATLKIMDSLLDIKELDNPEVVWRLNAMVGMLAIAQSDIETMIIIMEDN